MAGDGKGRGAIGKLNEATHAAIVKAIGAGLPRRHAAALAGISYVTLHNWLARGRREAEGPYFEFFAALKKAESEFIARNVKAIEVAGKVSWQARAWLLERMFPEEFSSLRQEVAQLKKEHSAILKRLEAQNGQALGGDSGGAAGQGRP
jgi:hypothetical protein